MDDKKQSEAVAAANACLDECRKEVGKRIIGQQGMIDGLLMGILSGGHVLLEGVPGLAKTLAVRTIAEVLTAEFKRLQFTPDLLPSDLIGTMIYRPQTGEFVPRKGPVFANIILADEINRAPAKVQSALLEAMQEKQVTIGSATYPLPDPFFVLATQNPIEQEGTYPLPEAQLDRFIMKLKIDYPQPDDELTILRRLGVEHSVKVRAILTREKIGELRSVAEAILVDPSIEEYIVALIAATREKDRSRYPFSRYIEFGASTRATICLYRCSKLQAMFSGRNYVLPEDVKNIAGNVLRHRLVLSYEAESEELTAEDILGQVLAYVPVP